MGDLYIIIAPSGAGKTSLVEQLLVQNTNLYASISHTTRSARKNEQNGVNYHFISKADFINMSSEGDFLESAEVYGYNYGTSKKWVDSQLTAGRDVILEIDWQGAQQVRNILPNACSIFILPPSLEALKQRLQERGQDDIGTIEDRMREAQNVIIHFSEADFVVVNDEFETALQDINAIIKAQRLSARNQTIDLRDLIENLTKG
ncbi:MAG: guanylate kinase [Gammaproteobacteria bacterium]|nr:guanylate kinase [Gammaproteobacteria bacterium]